MVYFSSATVITDTDKRYKILVDEKDMQALKQEIFVCFSFFFSFVTNLGLQLKLVYRV